MNKRLISKQNPVPDVDSRPSASEFVAAALAWAQPERHSTSEKQTDLSHAFALSAEPTVTHHNKAGELPLKDLGSAEPVERFNDDLAFRCEREPIHVPGSIQPHGALLAAIDKSGEVTHASENLQHFIGVRASDAIGQTLSTLLGKTACAYLSNIGAAGDDNRVYVVTGLGGGMLHLRAHRSGSRLCIDIEPMELEAGREVPVFNATSALKNFRFATSGVQLCNLAVQGLKSIGGYDRVMAYRFGDSGDGEVIAEAREDRLEPYIGLRYPASDIPAQARRLYMSQRVGAIADSAYHPIPLLANPLDPDASPLDLTHSSLRSVSPIHCEYMRNMGTAASLTIGLVSNGQLWGMLVCHHGNARIAGPRLRASAEIIGETVSLLLASLADAEVSAQQLGRYEMQRRIAERLGSPVSLQQAMLESKQDLLDLVRASGAVLRLSGAIFCVGLTPPLDLAEQALSLLLRIRGNNDLLEFDDVGLRFAELAGCTTDGSGAMLLLLESGSDDAILWFRPEMARTVTWGGDPNAHASADPVSGRISPRRSFASWQETVRGRSEAWSAADQALAKEVRVAVGAASAQRARAALRESEARFQLLAEHSGVVVTLNDLEGTYRYVSPAVENVFGWRPEEIVGRSMMEFVHPNDRYSVEAGRKALVDGVSKRSSCYRVMRSDGTWLWVEDHARMRNGRDGTGPVDCVVVMRDATERKATEDELAALLESMGHLASTDSLTALANRRRFDEVADIEWRRCKREKLPLSVLLLDVDYFKRFNDCYGHLAGDVCLRAIAAQLIAVAHRAGDLAARYGGEEFLLLLPNTGVEGAMALAERVRGLIECLGIAHVENLPGAVVTISIGVATAQPGECTEGQSGDIQDLLLRADSALYRAKDSGRNRVASA